MSYENEFFVHKDVTVKLNIPPVPSNIHKSLWDMGDWNIMILVAWLDKRVIGSHPYTYNVSYPQIPILDTNPIKLVSDWSEISSRLLMTITTPKGSYNNAVEYFLSASQEPLCVSTGHSRAGLLITSYTTNVIIKFGWHENQRIMLVLLQ